MNQFTHVEEEGPFKPGDKLLHNSLKGMQAWFVGYAPCNYIEGHPCELSDMCLTDKKILRVRYEKEGGECGSCSTDTHLHKMRWRKE